MWHCQSGCTFRSTYRQICDIFRPYPRRIWINHSNQRHIYWRAPSCDWMLNGFKQQVQWGNWTRNNWDHIQHGNNCPLMRMSCIFQHQSWSTKYNLCHCYTPWWTMPLPANGLTLHRRWRSMVKRSVRCHQLGIAGCIRIHFAIISDGKVMIAWCGTQPRLWMCCRQWGSSINTILQSLYHWQLSSEDCQSKGGILSLLGLLNDSMGFGSDCLRKLREGVGVMAEWRCWMM